MRNQDLDYLVIAALLASLLYVAFTGLLMDFFGMHQFFLHNYAGYLSMALAGLHLALNWRRITSYLRRRLAGRSVPRPPVQVEPLPSPGRRRFLVSALAGIGGFVLGWLIAGRRLLPLPTAADAAPSLQGDIGQVYHRWSKPGYSLPLAVVTDWGSQPERYKTYANSKRIALPDPHGYQGLSLEEAIRRRRSIRHYAGQSLLLTELAQLLHAAQGITDPGRGWRAAPSAGALYPIETYVIAHDVAGLEAGLYHYAVADHQLEQLRAADLRPEIIVAGIGQELLGQAQVCFALAAIFQRTRWKYRERTYRYILLEAGHIGQNLYLAATSMGLGACAVGAFLDDALNKLLGLDGEQEAALYLVAVGKI